MIIIEMDPTSHLPPPSPNLKMDYLLHADSISKKIVPGI